MRAAGSSRDAGLVSIFRPGDRVRFRATHDTVADGVDGELGLVLAVGDDGRALVSALDAVLPANDDELDLEED